jgi:hypothetical protein
MHLELFTCPFSCRKRERFKITIEVDPLVIHIHNADWIKTADLSLSTTFSRTVCISQTV